ncbi:gliding motility-associated C-terminal domain-containing protein [Hymenobacter antarcticus]|uniref:Gliding motility-associated C-terminal domain-containing protein n=1 Tax=Hymenobacter antarcticus TaxID=486270 RepID=A0ABP7QE88_9BACT
MKLLTRCSLLLTLCWLGSSQQARAQGCASPNPPPFTFEIFDVTASPAVRVDAMCVGRRYSFEQYPGRNIPLNLLTYGVLPGRNTTYTNSVPVACVPPNQAPYIYTPTAAEVGDVTISEFANVSGSPTYYIRNVEVVGTPPPTFRVDACPGGSALVTITDTNYNSYSVPGFGTVVRNVPTIVQLPAGATSITVTGNYTANRVCEGSRTLPISLPVPQQPLLTNLTLQGPLPSSAATLAVSQLPAGFLYTLQKEGPAGTFTDVTTVTVAPGSSSLTVPAAAGCYRIARRDFCGGSVAATPAICTLGLTGTSSQNRNQLLLSDGGTGGPYTVTRNGATLTGFTVISGGLEDPNVVCGTTYTYRVTATLAGGRTSVSNEVSILTQSLIPPARPLLVASFNLNNVVVLTPVLAAGPALPAGSTLRYRRSTGGQAPVDFGTATSLRPRRDSTALAELRAQPPCYSVQLLDVCRNTSPESTSTCPALLTAGPADPDGTTAALSWTAFSGPGPAVPSSYILQRLASDGTVLNTLPVSGGSAIDLTPPPDRQVLRYRLQISGGGLPGGTFSYSNIATVSRRILLTMPTAFTPNGDGLNDVFEVKGKYLRDYTFVVVDRNGQEVFRGTQRSEAWDGRIRGRAPVLGAYVWRFQQDGEDGQRFTATGTVTLLN